MNVQLVSYTKSVIDPEMDLLDQIAYVARVSNPSNQMNTETAEKLINYLLLHKHWSPLEMVDCTVEIECTRDIGRQILRHRAVFQEWSGRYTQMSLGHEFKEARLQDSKNRQNSIEIEDEKLQNWWLEAQSVNFQEAYDIYEEALKKGIAKEVARSVLPEGNILTRMYMKNSIRNWIHYIDVRTSQETQKEHREVALAISKVIEPIFPMIKQFTHGT
jgi:thymidylate synthase (FAD)